MHQMQYTLSIFAINTSTGSASTLLMLRTIAVWDRSRFVMVPLVITGLGQWALLLHSISTVQSSWSDTASVCVVHSVSRDLIEANYIYSKSSARFSLRCIRRGGMLNIGVECSDVIRPYCLGSYYNRIGPVSHPIFTLATSFPTGHHLLPCHVHR